MIQRLIENLFEPVSNEDMYNRVKHMFPVIYQFEKEIRATYSSYSDKWTKAENEILNRYSTDYDFGIDWHIVALVFCDYNRLILSSLDVVEVKSLLKLYDKWKTANKL